ncbi:hypothetical protein GGX14DRAFT_582711 [Mycena pura]|uniref:Uncharacterized protein n=1 Tax=Mycena pura TaxID=153505 RepID=A0AAD6YVP6_9AGAR|nr:hypothetical protein GGX14DRAFT_582711 [Mycena pura]
MSLALRHASSALRGRIRPPTAPLGKRLSSGHGEYKIFPFDHKQAVSHPTKFAVKTAVFLSTAFCIPFSAIYFRWMRSWRAVAILSSEFREIGFDSPVRPSENPSDRECCHADRAYYYMYVVYAVRCTVHHTLARAFVYLATWELQRAASLFLPRTNTRLQLHPRLSDEHAMDTATRAAAVTMGRLVEETPPALPRPGRKETTSSANRSASQKPKGRIKGGGGEDKRPSRTRTPHARARAGAAWRRDGAGATDAVGGLHVETLASVRSRTPVLGTPAVGSSAASANSMRRRQDGCPLQRVARDFITYGAAPRALDVASKRYQISGFEAAVRDASTRRPSRYSWRLNCPILDTIRTALFPALPAAVWTSCLQAAAWRSTVARSAAPTTDLEWTAFLGECMHEVETVSNGCRMSVARERGLLAPVRGLLSAVASAPSQPFLPPVLQMSPGRKVDFFFLHDYDIDPSVTPCCSPTRSRSRRGSSDIIAYSSPAASRLMQITSPTALFINAKIRSNPLSAWSCSGSGSMRGGGGLRERRWERRQERRRRERRRVAGAAAGGGSGGGWRERRGRRVAGAVAWLPYLDTPQYRDDAQSVDLPQYFSIYLPGILTGLNEVWITVASILATLKSVDDDGKEVEPSYEYSRGLIPAPLPFKCSITPRSQQAAEAIQGAARGYRTVRFRWLVQYSVNHECDDTIV